MDTHGVAASATSTCAQQPVRAATARILPSGGRLVSLVQLQLIQPLDIGGTSSETPSAVAALVQRCSSPMAAEVAQPAASTTNAETQGDPSHEQCHLPANAICDSKVRSPKREPSHHVKHARTRRLSRCDVWLRAVQALRILLGNTLVCVSCVWLITFCYSRGNIVSGKPSVTQSDAEFVAGMMVVVHFVFFATVLVVQLPVLLSLKLAGVSEIDGQLRVVLCCLKLLLRYTYRVFMLSTVITIAMFIGLQSEQVGTQLQAARFYIYSFVTQLNNTAITLAVRRIYKGDTVVGRSKQSNTRQSTLYRSVLRFVKVYALTSLKPIIVVLAALYVQTMRDYRIKGMSDFVAFTLGSLVLKHVVKEIAKRGITRLNVNDPRTIFAVVGLPTVLIDTQVRIVLQRVSSSKYTVMWTIAMAVIEIALRWSKVVLTKREVRRKELQFAKATAWPQTASSDTKSTITATTLVHRRAFASVVPTPTQALSSEQALAKWKHQILTFQIAESYANMSAEYIAIGCSTCILYFFWDHPKYMLGSSGASDANSFTMPWTHTPSLGIQVLVEVAVDYLSCVLEIGAGVNFQQLRRFRAFLALLFIVLAVVNVQICVMMYLIV